LLLIKTTTAVEQAKKKKGVGQKNEVGFMDSILSLAHETAFS
jgi:hypothetical protein